MFRLAMESKGSKIARQVLRDSVSETPVIVRVCCEGYDHIARLNVTCFFELSTSHTHTVRTPTLISRTVTTANGFDIHCGSVPVTALTTSRFT